MLNRIQEGKCFGCPFDRLRVAAQHKIIFSKPVGLDLEKCKGRRWGAKLNFACFFSF